MIQQEILVFAMFIVLFTTLFAGWTMLRTARNKERLLMIEKGIDLKDLNLMQSKKSPFPWLRIGIVLTGIAVGCIVLTLFLTGSGGEKFRNIPGFQIGVIVLFAGLSMILANFVGRAKDQK